MRRMSLLLVVAMPGVVEPCAHAGLEPCGSIPSNMASTLVRIATSREVDATASTARRRDSRRPVPAFGSPTLGFDGRVAADGLMPSRLGLTRTATQDAVGSSTRGAGSSATGAGSAIDAGGKQSEAPPKANPPATVGAENAPAAEEITPKLEEAVRRGFEYLRRQQKADGSFGQGRYGEHIGVTSLCAIALMADGNVPGRGDFGDSVQKALTFVLDHSTETGLLVSDETHGPMYGHGFATLFLGEIYGMNQEDDRVRDALVKAVQLIVGSQNDEGGWRYNPVPNDADVSVTICQVMGLRSARNAGIKVPKSTIDDAIRYVRECQNTDGGFRYMKDSGGSLWPRTAAGVASLFYAGVYEDQSIDRGLDYLMKNAFPRGGAFGGSMSQAHYFYGHYYAVQAMYLAGGERWKAWWPAIREELLARQNADGSWSDSQAGDSYGTAMALIVLQMPKRYLPIFQR
jgi:prenyltransferase beta subunit